MGTIVLSPLALAFASLIASLAIGRAGGTGNMFWLTESETNFPNINEALASAFPDQHSEATQGTVARLRNHLQANDAKGLPRAAVFTLAKNIKCRQGECNQGKGCSQSQSVALLAASLENTLFKRSPYPLIIFHEDWEDSDFAPVVQAAPSTLVIWHKINMAEQGLPDYVDVHPDSGVTGRRDRIIDAFKAVHMKGDLTLGSKDGKGFHGFGYRMMCRFFSGLVHHAPLLREVDYYMRLDGGDSRLDSVTQDPFAVMRAKGARYGYYEEPKHCCAIPSYVLRHCIASLLVDNATIHKNMSSVPKVFQYDTPANFKSFKNLKCGDLAPHGGVSKIPLIPSHVRSGMPFFAFNNFEVVDMRYFRSSTHWALFMKVERSLAFFCIDGTACKPNARATPGIGDAPFRGYSLSLVLDHPNQIIALKNSTKYRHPVPPCG